MRFWAQLCVRRDRYDPSQINECRRIHLPVHFLSWQKRWKQIDSEETRTPNKYRGNLNAFDYARVNESVNYVFQIWQEFTLIIVPVFIHLFNFTAAIGKLFNHTRTRTQTHTDLYVEWTPTGFFCKGHFITHTNRDMLLKITHLLMLSLQDIFLNL